jgi:hypothetical protein
MRCRQSPRTSPTVPDPLAHSGDSTHSDGCVSEFDQGYIQNFIQLIHVCYEIQYFNLTNLHLPWIISHHHIKSGTVKNSWQGKRLNHRLAPGSCPGGPAIYNKITDRNHAGTRRGIIPWCGALSDRDGYRVPSTV